MWSGLGQHGSLCVLVCSSTAMCISGWSALLKLSATSGSSSSRGGLFGRRGDGGHAFGTQLIRADRRARASQSACKGRTRRGDARHLPGFGGQDDVAGRDRLWLGSEVAVVWVRPRDAAEAEAEQVAVKGDAAVVRLMGVFAYVVAELVQRVVRRLDERSQGGVSRQSGTRDGVEVVEVVADAPRLRGAWERDQDAPVERLDEFSFNDPVSHAEDVSWERT